MEPTEKKRAEQKARLVSLLQKIPLFADLNPSNTRKVLSVCLKITLKEGELLCSKGDVSNSMYILLSGKLGVKMKDSAPFITIESGNSIGEMGLFTGEPRSATVQALSDSALLCLRSSDINVLIRKEPLFGIKIMSKIIKILSDRVKADNVRFQEFQKQAVSK